MQAVALEGTCRILNDVDRAWKRADEMLLMGYRGLRRLQTIKYGVPVERDGTEPNYQMVYKLR
jgi:hypothetical protein